MFSILFQGKHEIYFESFLFYQLENIPVLDVVWIFTLPMRWGKKNFFHYGNFMNVVETKHGERRKRQKYDVFYVSMVSTILKKINWTFMCSVFTHWLTIVCAVCTKVKEIVGESIWNIPMNEWYFGFL